jgi:transposase-like protein
MMERTNKELKRRSKVVGHFLVRLIIETGSLNTH